MTTPAAERQSADEKALESYSDPANVLDILSIGGQRPATIYGTGLCEHEGSKICSGRCGTNISEGRCGKFKLIDGGKTAVEALLLNAMTTDQHNVV